MSGFLLDTCVLSEFTKRRADPGLVEWLATEDESSMFVCELSLGELEKGLNRLSDSSRRTKLRAFIDQEIIERFESRIVPVDVRVWRRWGALCGESERAGRPLPVIDSLLTACALVHQLSIVTRNESDFSKSGAPVVNPWRAAN
ncbi:MAG: type II toxin-antitoxin system VapC family toxin [Archangiaceae bacterium]|nr:type II toxin-antitoxin system VapC family toxin [Archangiaceae bacterium]